MVVFFCTKHKALLGSYLKIWSHLPEICNACATILRRECHNYIRWLPEWHEQKPKQPKLRKLYDVRERTNRQNLHSMKPQLQKLVKRKRNKDNLMQMVRRQRSFRFNQRTRAGENKRVLPKTSKRKSVLNILFFRAISGCDTTSKATVITGVIQPKRSRTGGYNFDSFSSPYMAVTSRKNLCFMVPPLR